MRVDNWLNYAVQHGVEGKMHCCELAKLVELARDRHVLEVGAYAGLSAWCMAHSARSVLSVDTFKAATNGQDQVRGFTTLDAYRRNLHRFPHVHHFVGTSEEAATRLGGAWDLVFLDATHTYEEVLADIQRWAPTVRSGGVFAFHDYGHADYPGVKEAVDEVYWPLDDVEVTLGWLYL